MDLTRGEAEAIAKEIDPHAGGFFHNCLARAALMGAEAQRKKSSQQNGSWSELRDLYHNQDSSHHCE